MKHDILALANFVKQSLNDKTAFKLPLMTGAEFKELLRQLRQPENVS